MAISSLLRAPVTSRRSRPGIATTKSPATGKLDGKQLHDQYRYEFVGTRLQYSYNTLCILDYSDKELSDSSNPFAWVMLAAKQAVFRFLESYVQFEKKETIPKFRRKIDEITDKKNFMDIFEQIQEMDREEGRKGASREFVRRLLARNGMTLDEIATLAGVSVADVKKLKRQKKAK